MSEKIRKIPIRRVGTRINLFFGGDRELVMLSGLLSITLIVPVANIYGVIGGVILWSFAIFALRRMAKADPNMRKVYMRHVLYRKSYDSHSTPWRNNYANKYKKDY